MSTSSSTLRKHIETALLGRVPSALTPAARLDRDLLSTGIEAIDSLLHGGLPAAAITELVGSHSSGRTSLTLAFLGAALNVGGVCAWIDASDSFDPESGAANGLDLERLLWVRCGHQLQPSTSATGHATALALDKKEAPHTLTLSALPPRHVGSGSPHPRAEGSNMPAAVGALLQAHGGLYDQQMRRERKQIGTPGMPNRPLSLRSEEREEQANSDRQPPRRGENLTLTPRCTPRRNPQPHRSLQPASSAPSPLQALDHALRSTDLLLQSGGFGAIVLDLGNIPPEIAWRIPMATWFRFRAACERSRVSLLLLTQHPCARSSAELVVRLHPGEMAATGNVLQGIHYQAAIERSRLQERGHRVVSIRRPAPPAKPGAWCSQAAWVQSR